MAAANASMLRCSLLHLAGVKPGGKDDETLGDSWAPVEAIRTLGALDSHRTGHPELRWASGVKTAAGPLR